jgi:hypothetical protein
MVGSLCGIDFRFSSDAYDPDDPLSTLIAFELYSNAAG